MALPLCAAPASPSLTLPTLLLPLQLDQRDGFDENLFFRWIISPIQLTPHLPAEGYIFSLASFNQKTPKEWRVFFLLREEGKTMEKVNREGSGFPVILKPGLQALLGRLFSDWMNVFKYFQVIVMEEMEA